MKIAFVGKGGSGKTTLSALFARYIAEQKKPVVAIDADINQHLATALGENPGKAEAIPALGYSLDEIMDYLAANNQTLRPTSLFLKSSPPGKGSRLLRITEPNELFRKFSHTVNGVQLFVTGVYDEGDIGVRCYHGKQGGAEILLNHLIDGKHEYVITDLTAGADSFATGIFLKFDITFLVVEPTAKSISVYKQYKTYGQGHGINIKVIGNKVEDNGDEEFIRNEVGEDYFASIGRSRYVKSIERGEVHPLSQLEPENAQVLAKMLQEINNTPQDWARYHRRTIDAHKKKALAEKDLIRQAKLLAQVDETFQYV